MQLLDCSAWVIWKLPAFNSYRYRYAAISTSLISAGTAVYFIISAMRAQRYLSNDGDDDEAAQVANTEAVRRLMRRVRASGCLLLVTTVAMGGSTLIAFNPAGFVIACLLTWPFIMANSLLLIDSFAPAKGAPQGPLRDASQFLWLTAKDTIAWVGPSQALSVLDEGKARPDIDLLRFLIGKGPEPGTTDNARRRASFLPLALGNTNRRLSASGFVQVLPTPEAKTTTTEPFPWSSLPVSQRSGVSYSFLLAVLEAWKIPSEMTTYVLCDKYVKRACRKANCGFFDLMLRRKCPDEWFGEMSIFVSHWWGYNFVALVGSEHQILISLTSF